MRRGSLDKPPNRLRELRKEHGVKPYDLAAEFRVDQTTVYRWESGLNQVPDEVKLALARRYGVSPAYLMGWDEIEVAG